MAEPVVVVFAAAGAGAAVAAGRESIAAAVAAAAEAPWGEVLTQEGVLEEEEESKCWVVVLGES